MEEQEYKILSEKLLGSDSYITFNKSVAELFGIEPAIYLSTLIWKAKYYEKRDMLVNGYFFSTQSDMTETCMLSPFKQSESIKVLRQYKIIDVIKRGMPPKNHFKINHKILFEMISSAKSTFTLPKINVDLTLNQQSIDIKSYNNIKINNNSSNNSSSKEEESCSDEQHLSLVKIPLEIKQIPKLNRRTEEQITKSLSQLTPVQQKPLSNEMPTSTVINRQKLKGAHKQSVLSPVPEDHLTEEMKIILNHWEELGLKISSKTAKTHKDGLKKLRRLFGGQLLFGKKYTVEEVQQSITRFSLAVKSPEYLPQDKKQLVGINIDNFIQNEYGKVKSYFQLYLLEYNPKPINPILPNPYPEIVGRLKKRFIYEVLGNIKPTFKQADENNFIKASTRLIEYWKENKSKMVGEFNSSQKADFLFDAIKNSANGGLSIVTSGWFCSDLTFSTRLSAWLQQERITEAGTDNGGCDVGYSYGSKYNLPDSIPEEAEDERDETSPQRKKFKQDVLNVISSRRPKDIKVDDEEEPTPTEDWQIRVAKFKAKQSDVEYISPPIQDD